MQAAITFPFGWRQQGNLQPELERLPRFRLLACRCSYANESWKQSFAKSKSVDPMTLTFEFCNDVSQLIITITSNEVYYR